VRADDAEPSAAADAAALVSGQLLYCLCGFASKKSFTIGTMTGMRSISVTCVVLGKMANLDAERGRIESGHDI
jgi:Kef-type K+ transport system membrane component KefB